MNNERNQRIYRLWSPAYDIVFGRTFQQSRRRAVALLDLQAGERLLISGVGTGFDLSYLPAGLSVVGADLSAEMLGKARRKANPQNVNLLKMDAQALGFREASFDAVLLNLILSVVPNGKIAFNEAWRLLKPGGRMVIFDKFLPEGTLLTPGRRLVGRVISSLGTDPNRRLSEIISGTSGLTLERDEPSLLQGQYRILRLKKE